MRLKSIGVVVALILTMFMAAIETSIISLAMPTIREDLHAGNNISLVLQYILLLL